MLTEIERHKNTVLHQQKESCNIIFFASLRPLHSIVLSYSDPHTHESGSDNIALNPAQVTRTFQTSSGHR